MSRIDERIRREVKDLARPVDVDGVAEHVMRRKARCRLVHRIHVATLALSVVAGSLAGVYGLLRVFGPREATPLGDGSPTLSGLTPPEMFTPTLTECHPTSVEGDMTGDGVLDLLIVYWPSETTCEPVPEGVRYQARVVTSAGTPDAVALLPQELPECETVFTGCKAFGAPDIDADGRAEMAIAIAPGGPATFFALYRFDPDRPSGQPALIPFTIAPPGDPWREEYGWGFPPGPAVFASYGSSAHLHWGTCWEEDGEHHLVTSTALRTEHDPDVYDVHSTVFRVDGVSLEVVGTQDQRVNGKRFEGFGELCGSRLFVRV
ncbi:MAG: hypothetical protein ACRDHS_05490 [Actinomycetota bacterium]